MEFIIFLTISGLCAVAMFYAAVNAARKPGQPQRGLFRIAEADGKAPARKPVRTDARRSGPWQPPS